MISILEKEKGLSHWHDSVARARSVAWSPDLSSSQWRAQMSGLASGGVTQIWDLSHYGHGSADLTNLFLFL